MAQPSFWGKYDIRAVVSDHFGPAQYQRIGQAYAQFLQQQLGPDKTTPWVAVGHDARLHSPALADALIEGLTGCGINVVSLGLSTSPVVYFSEHLPEINTRFPKLSGALMVTASHNPSEYNGVKFTYCQRSLSEAEFLALQALYFEQQEVETPVSSCRGEIKPYNILPEYLAWFEQAFGKVGAGIRVVVDSGNATAGIVAPEALRRIGCDVVELFTEPDGRFPNHHPDPCVHKNLTFLVDKVREAGADLGIAFDGDADRLGIVDESGRIMPGDQITLFLADDVLQAQPGSTVVFDIKSTQTLFGYMRERNGIPILAPSGHAFMKRIMQEKDIPLGGELSGHLFFRDRHWGFDDALYAACRFIEALAHRRQQQAGYRLSNFADTFPQTLISEEIRIACSREEGRQLMERLQSALEKNPDYLGSRVVDLLTIDGLRANIENGFFLIRASNTEPCVTLRFEAPDQDTYQQIEQRIAEIRAS